jgi:hypothetical protein
MFIAHAYQQSKRHSTILVEVDSETLRRCGLDTASEDESRAFWLPSEPNGHVHAGELKRIQRMRRFDFCSRRSAQSRVIGDAAAVNEVGEKRRAALLANRPSAPLSVQHRAAAAAGLFNRSMQSTVGLRERRTSLGDP